MNLFNVFFLKVRYTPLAPGNYFLSVKYNGAHIVGSPFRIECTGKYNAIRIYNLSKI